MSLEALEDMAMPLNRIPVLNMINTHNAGPLRVVTCVKVNTTGIVEGDKTLLLTPFSEDTRKLSDVIGSLGLDNSRTYHITLVKGDAERMTVDPKLALDHIHGINRVVLHAGWNDRHGVIDTIQKQIKDGKLDLKGASLLRYD